MRRAAVDMVATGDYRAAEKKFEESWRMLEVCPELDNAAGQRVWAQRKAAWAIEELPALSVGPREQDVGPVCWQIGGS